MSADTATASEPILVNAREAARLLGISERSLWTLTKRGEVPHVRIGARLLYRPASLTTWAVEVETKGAIG